jgi:hypothetical protein
MVALVALLPALCALGLGPGARWRRRRIRRRRLGGVARVAALLLLELGDTSREALVVCAKHDELLLQLAHSEQQLRDQALHRGRRRLPGLAAHFGGRRVGHPRFVPKPELLRKRGAERLPAHGCDRKPKSLMLFSRGTSLRTKWLPPA